MALNNTERVAKAMEALRAGLAPFVEREMKAAHAQLWFKEMKSSVSEMQASMFGDEAKPQYDARSLLAVMTSQWQPVFRNTLGHAERALVSELREVGNKWAHQGAFSGDDTYRALDSAARLLTAVSATEADEVERMKQELLRLRYDEQIRHERTKELKSTVESTVTGSLKPWREVVTPHPDVASGRYQQAEFAADLWQVHLGEGSDEYRDPREFFRRTYMTESLKALLTSAVQRLSPDDGGGDPVVQLQTNFGGGKTHAMLALYHLVSGKPATELIGLEPVLAASGVQTLPKARAVVLVGNKISPGNPSVKPDGTRVHTLWGELAYQLGGKPAYERIRHDDERATSPGDAIRELLNEYGPALILVDEWVAYARQLHDESDLPGGSFEVQFSFAQALTESAKLARNCLLVISLPASDTGSSSEDIEVGGRRGREALDRLRNVTGRLEASWQPATAEESFEIVRRRLFEPVLDPAAFKARDLVVRSFYDLYRTQHQEFPEDAGRPEYEDRLKAAYPIHPEIFDQLYGTWSTISKFQRTRGVLRLMAKVIHVLWKQGDRNPLIMPGNIPLAASVVASELTKFVGDEWRPIIARDIDGADSLPNRIDGEVGNLGKYFACRRVARAIYLGTAPSSAAANLGIEDRRVKLGCVMPGEGPAIFGDALRRMASQATYLYQDGPRYWYATQPTLTKLADDRAEELKRHPERTEEELAKRVKAGLGSLSDFSRIHTFPATAADVPDERDARLVVLGPDHAYAKEAGSSAQAAAEEILKSRGNGPRLFQNSLVFLAADRGRLGDLEEAIRRYIAWNEVIRDQESHVAPHILRQAQEQRSAADKIVTARVPESYQWLLVPSEERAGVGITWDAIRLNGSDPLAVRAAKRLRTDEKLITSLGPVRLRMELDRVPLWRNQNNTNVEVRQLANDFAQYLYLPRLKNEGVLLQSIADGVRSLTWAQDAFGYAETYDEPTGRYRGLKGGETLLLGTDVPPGLLVRADIALRQKEAEERPTSGGTPAHPEAPTVTGGLFEGGATDRPTVPETKTRYFGSVPLDSTRVVRDVGKITEEVISHLTSLVGSDVKITLEIEATVPDGVPAETIRIVTQNARDLKFDSQGFER